MKSFLRSVLKDQLLKFKSLLTTSASFLVCFLLCVLEFIRILLLLWKSKNKTGESVKIIIYQILIFLFMSIIVIVFPPVSANKYANVIIICLFAVAFSLAMNCFRELFFYYRNNIGADENGAYKKLWNFQSTIYTYAFAIISIMAIYTTTTYATYTITDPVEIINEDLLYISFITFGCMLSSDLYRFLFLKYDIVENVYKNRKF